jgi:hypothetical protein
MLRLSHPRLAAGDALTACVPCRQISDDFRRGYAQLWRALIFADVEAIERHARAMHAGELYPLFAAMLTTRPWDQVTNPTLGHLHMSGKSEVCTTSNTPHPSHCSPS